jgi:hypothetical protein
MVTGFSLAFTSSISGKSRARASDAVIAIFEPPLDLYKKWYH